MTVEAVTYINDLEPANPKGGDSIAQGDNHIRNTKLALRNTFPNIDGEVSATDEEMNYLVGLTGPIKDEIESGSNDLAQLAADVAKNTADIATNASGIATNASGIATNASGIASNDAELADHEGRISANAQGIASLDQNKADKSYVDAQNNAQDAVIATKADKTYVDGQDDAIIARLAELENFVSKGGGSMIKPVEQPASIGQFSIKQGSYSKPATDDIYYAAPVNGNNTVTFSVPAGNVFVMDYLFALGYVDIDLNSIKVDGVTMMPGVSGVMQFDSPFDDDFDFAAWPTPFSGSSIRVEQSVQFTYRDRVVSGDSPEVCISGLFVEA